MHRRPVRCSCTITLQETIEAGIIASKVKCGQMRVLNNIMGITAILVMFQVYGCTDSFHMIIGPANRTFSHVKAYVSKIGLDLN